MTAMDTPTRRLTGAQIVVAHLVNEGVTHWQSWPKGAVSELMITRSGKPDAIKDVEGSMTRVAFLRGEPIRRDKLVKAGAGGFMSAVLPGGKRAVAIKIDNGGDSTAGGFILPNDRVDDAIGAITRAARTGKIGDGKIFVLDLESALRVRTGETGDAAL